MEQCLRWDFHFNFSSSEFWSSGDLIFAFAWKTLDACSYQLDNALVLSSSVSHMLTSKEPRHIYIFLYSETFGWVKLYGFLNP